MAKSTKPVSNAIKQKAVAKYFKGGTLDEVADEYGISKSSLQRFIKAEKLAMKAVGVQSNKQITLNKFSEPITKTKTMSATAVKKKANGATHATSGKKVIIKQPYAPPAVPESLIKPIKTIALTTKAKTKKIDSEIVHTYPIEKTKEYGAFALNIKNRPINEKVVTEFIKKFQSGHNYMVDHPILVDENFDILDGQHRYEACKRMGIDLYYRHVTDLTIDNVQQVQSNNGWKPTDYMVSYMKQDGKESYKKLDDFIKRFKMPVSTAVGLLCGYHSIQSGFGMKGSGFKEGTFELTEQNEAYATLVMLHCEEFGKHGFLFFRERSFIGSVAKIREVKGYKEEHMMEKMSKFGSRLKRQMTTKEYLLNLEEVYNYKTRDNESLRFS